MEDHRLKRFFTMRILKVNDEKPYQNDMSKTASFSNTKHITRKLNGAIMTGIMKNLKND